MYGFQAISKGGRKGQDELADNAEPVSGVAERYASALFELARDEKALDDVAQELDQFAEMMEASEDLTTLVRSPAFTADEQTRAVSAILAKAGINGLGGNLIKTAADNRRLFAVPGMITAFHRLLAKERGEVSATVTSAEPLSDAQLNALRAALKEAIGKDPLLEQHVDASLIGGLIIQVGSRMIDTSLRTKLNSMKYAMKEAG